MPAVQKGSQSYFVDPSKIVWDGWNNDGTNCLTADLDRIQRRHMAVCIGLLDEERFNAEVLVNALLQVLCIVVLYCGMKVTLVS